MDREVPSHNFNKAKQDILLFYRMYFAVKCPSKNVCPPAPFNASVCPPDCSIYPRLVMAQADYTSSGGIFSPAKNQYLPSIACDKIQVPQFRSNYKFIKSAGSKQAKPLNPIPSVGKLSSFEKPLILSIKKIMQSTLITVLIKNSKLYKKGQPQSFQFLIITNQSTFTCLPMRQLMSAKRSRWLSFYAMSLIQEKFLAVYYVTKIFQEKHFQPQSYKQLRNSILMLSLSWVRLVIWLVIVVEL